MNYRLFGFKAFFVILALITMSILPGSVSAEGTETLGLTGIDIAQGTGVATAGIGLIDSQPASFDIEVPSGATILQTILYWEGQMSTDIPGDDIISINGIEVQGQLIGGQAFFFRGAYSSSFRADITDLDIVESGTTTLTIEGAEFTKANNGAGIMVIYDDGSGLRDIQIRDGLDLACIVFPEPRKSTVAQTFNFEPADMDRTADLSMFFSSVEGETSGEGPLRPSAIDITVEGGMGTLDVTVDFEDVDLGDDPILRAGNTVTSGGFVFSSEGDIFVVGDPGECGGGCADNGSKTSVSLDADGDYPGGDITVTEQSGAVFSIAAVDLAEGVVDHVDFPQATSITITGTLEEGGTVSETFELDGIIDGNGGEADFQTFTTSALSEAQLVSAVISAQGPSPLGDGAYSIDNLVLTTRERLMTTLVNELGSDDGEEWDTLSIEIDIPAGANSVTVQAFSRDDLDTGELPASFTWIGSVFSVVVEDTPPPPEEICFEVNVVTATSYVGTRYDKLLMQGSIKLPDGAAFDPDSDDVTLTLWNNTVILPAGSFKQVGRYGYGLLKYCGYLPDMGSVVIYLDLGKCNWKIYLSGANTEPYIKSSGTVVGMTLGGYVGIDSFEWIKKGSYYCNMVKYAKFIEYPATLCCEKSSKCKPSKSKYRCGASKRTKGRVCKY